MRTISFCFDDGFRRSAEIICEVFGRQGLSACFAVLSQPENALDPFISGADCGDWSFWRDATTAGHEVAPHGLMHERYHELTFEQVQASVSLSLDIMESELPGFERRDSLFHVPYLSAPAGIVDWLGTQLLGVRVAGKDQGLNRWTSLRMGGTVDCICFGPDSVANSVRARIEEFRSQEGWLVVALHGIDGEGWGSVTRTELEDLLEAAKVTGAAIAPPNQVLGGALRAA